MFCRDRAHYNMIMKLFQFSKYDDTSIGGDGLNTTSKVPMWNLHIHKLP